MRIFRWLRRLWRLGFWWPVTRDEYVFDGYVATWVVGKRHCITGRMVIDARAATAAHWR